MRRPRCTVLVVGALVSACSGEALFLGAPLESFGAELLWISVVGAPERERVLALEPVETARPLDAELFTDDDVRLRVGVFDEDLCALALPAGPLPLAAPGAGRCLPEPPIVFDAKIVDGRLAEDWTPSSAPFGDDAYRHVEPGACDAGLLACLARGDCYSDAACGDCPDVTNDFRVPSVRAPAAPASPTWAGTLDWPQRRFTAPDLTLRRPWAAGTEPCTSPGRILFPADTACYPRGCLPDRWPKGLGGVADVVYVDGAVASGDGSIGAPFATIAEALLAVPAGGTIALASGEHRVRNLRPDRPVRIVGTCARGSFIVVDDFTAGSALRTAADLTIEDVTLDLYSYGVAVGAARLVLRNVELRGGLIAVTLDPGAQALLEDVVVSGTSSSAVVVQDADLEATRLGVTTIEGVGLLVAGAATADVTELSVYDVVASGGRGHAVWLRDGASATLARSAVWKVAGTGVRADDADLALSTVDIRDVDRTNGSFGVGIDQRGGVASYTQVYVERPELVGIRLRETKTTTLTDIAVRDVPPAVRGSGLIVDGASVGMANVHLANLSGLGLSMTGTATISDLFVSGISLAGAASAIGAQVEGDVTLTTAHVVDAGDVGVEVLDGRVRITDLAIEDTALGFAANGGAIDLHRARFEELGCAWSVASDVTTVSGTNIAIGPDADSDAPKCGLRIGGDDREGPTVELSGLRIHEAPGVDIASASPVAISNFIGEALRGDFGVRVASGASATILGADLHATGEALRVGPGAEAVLGRVLVRSVQTDAPAFVVEGALEATVLEVDEGRATGVVLCAGAEATIRDARVRARTTALSMPRGFDASTLSTRAQYIGGVYGLCDAVVDPCAVSSMAR